MATNQNTLIPELRSALEREADVPNLLADREPPPKKKKAWWKYILLLALFVLYAFIIKIDFPVTGIAHVIPSQLLTLETQHEGVIDQIYVTSGDVVNSGDIIALLRNDDVMRELKTAKTELNQIRKKLLQIDRKKNYLRIVNANYNELYHNDIIARSEFEKVKLEYTHVLQEYDIYQDEMDTLRSTINYYQNALQKLKIVASMSGIILTKIENNLGAFVRTGDSVCKIANMEGYLLELPVNEKVINNFVVGEEATIRFNAFPRSPITGTVIKIEHTAWEKLKKVLVKERVINVHIQPDANTLDIKPGMTAHIKIHSGKIRFRS